MTTLMAIVEACENQLGWQPPYRPDVPPYRTRSLEVHKLRQAMTNPRFAHMATLRNLALALEFSRRRQLPVQSPVTLLYRIPDALVYADTTPAATPVAQQVTVAIRWEQGIDDTHSLRWIHRLTRATGPGQVEVLTEWKAAGRG
jgi:hypothetical protein